MCKIENPLSYNKCVLVIKLNKWGKLLNTETIKQVHYIHTFSCFLRLPLYIVGLQYSMKDIFKQFKILEIPSPQHNLTAKSASALSKFVEGVKKTDLEPIPKTKSQICIFLFFY